MSKIEFDLQFEPEYGKCVHITDSIRRITANNRGPFTFKGTNTYIVGYKSVAVIDPGPADESHIDNILKSIAQDSISHIFVTHTHRDHSPGARLLQDRTGAPIIGAGPHITSRELSKNETNPLDSSADSEHQPNQILSDNEVVEGDGWTLETVATPGHTANHLSFVHQEEGVNFIGDHVMAWSTTIVAPPDGSIRAYMASLDKLQNRSEKFYLPAHGGPVNEPGIFLEKLIEHRIGREKALLRELGKGPSTIASLVQEIYKDTPKLLHSAASLSMLAHLEHLIDRKMVSSSGGPAMNAQYRLC